MSKIEVVVPQLSESVAEATLLEWKAGAGEAVKAEQVLIEIETDKVILEVPSPASGVLAEVLSPNGATVRAGQVIARIDTEAAAAQPSKPAAAPAPAPQAAAPAAAAAPRVMPSAGKALAAAGIAASEVEGSGVGGRITRADVEAAAARKEAKPAPQTVFIAPPAASSSALPTPLPAVAPDPFGRTEERVPMTRLRARVAERLVQSQSACAILTTFNEVNMAPVIELRNRCKEAFMKEHGVKLGFMSFFVKAAVYALKKFPILNASIDGGDIIYHGYIDIGVAVSSPRGLVVPVLRNADQLTFAEIERQIADFGARSKTGKLTLEELTGGTFTVSNGGVFGSLFSTPIINPPQSGILGIHGTKERPVAENGQVVIRPMNYFALSYDHRLIDGREAVLALVAMKEALEDPARLLLNI